MRFRLTIEYDGTDFVGWQRQSNGPSVQAAIEDALTDMHGGIATAIRGAGRTDAGVHALGQVAHFDAPPDTRVPLHGYLRGLNAVLPRSIAILAVDAVADDFDARFSARGKIYRYTVWNHSVRSPRQARTAWHVRETIDTDAVRRAAASLVGQHDFRAFRASDCDRKTTNRIVRRLEVERQGPLITIDIEATAFLKNMVRIVVGTLIDVGRGRIEEAAIVDMIATGARSAGGMTAPPQGLTLLRVIY